MEVQLGLAEALARTQARPHLARCVPVNWLEIESEKRHHQRHPLYRWLNAESPGSDADPFADALDSALAASTGDVRSRCQRLTSGDQSDYWSAVCELYMVAALTGEGLPAKLGNPDVVVEDATGRVGVELNAVQETTDAARLQALLEETWDGELQAVIVVPDERVRITGREIEAIVGLMREAERVQRGTVTGPRYQGASIAVDLSSVIAPDKARANLEDGDPAFLITRSGVRSEIVDPWPGIEERVRAKRRQLGGEACALVAVELGHGHVTAYSWADRVRRGYDIPSLTTDAQIAGVVVYWQDLRRHVPYRALFVRNSTWTGTAAVLDRVLSALQAADVGSPA